MVFKASIKVSDKYASASLCYLSDNRVPENNYNKIANNQPKKFQITQKITNLLSALNQ